MSVYGEIWDGYHVVDDENPFTVDPLTREIKTKYPQTKVLMQGDHNSERFTFVLPRFIEGRDIGLCNVVQVCYINTSSSRETSTGVYTISDMEVYPFMNDVLTCSWLISQNATRHAGNLSFMLRFASVKDDATIEYAWNTGIYSDVAVADSLDSAESFENEYVDVIRQWENELMSAMLERVDISVKAHVDVRQINVNADNIEDLNNELDIQKARIDTFTSLQEGTTTGDAELIDARIDNHGNVFNNAGTAIRSSLNLQQEVVESAMKIVYLPIDCEMIEDFGYQLNKQKQVLMVSYAGAHICSGVIDKAGLYNLPVSTLLTYYELNETDYVDYIYYETVAKNDVYVEAGTRFYILDGDVPPSLKVTYLPEQLVEVVSPDETYSITEGTVLGSEELGGLLEDGQVRVTGTRYTLTSFPVAAGNVYRLKSAAFDYPTDVYRLFGFVKSKTLQQLQQYIQSDIRTNEGVIDIVLRAPIDGYLLVSNDTNTPANFTLTTVNKITRTSNIPRKEVQPYKKLLTIGDSLSGNNNLWQPTAIELLNIPEYGILGGAGLTVADQGADVNTIYNRVMAMELDESVDLITFWGGYNDFSVSITLSSLDEQLNTETRDPKTFYGGVLNCVEKILSTYPLKQVVMIGTTPFNVNGSWQVKTNTKGLKIIDYVNAFKEVADYYSIPFLDLLHTSGFNDYNYATYYLKQSYWLHPNATGNEIVGRKVAGFVKSINGEY